MRVLLVVVAVMACAAAPVARLTPGQEKLLRDRPSSGVAEKTLEIELLVYGPWHRQVEETAGHLAHQNQMRGEWAKEAARRRTVLEARRRLDGEGHWRTTDAK